MSNPKFKKGDFIRYGFGSTALMQVDTIYPDSGGNGRHRYYGEHCYGGSCGAYESDCSLFSDADFKTWTEERTRYHLA